MGGPSRPCPYPVHAHLLPSALAPLPFRQEHGQLEVLELLKSQPFFTSTRLAQLSNHADILSRELVSAATAPSCRLTRLARPDRGVPLRRKCRA